jgi:hypothetical protein
VIAQALFFYQFHSIKNRLTARVRRMKEPRYLFGAVAGAAYFYWFFFRNFNHGDGPMRRAFFGGDPEMLQGVYALILLAWVLLTWIFHRTRATLAFTESEVAFLFPAPVTREQLLHFKLLRSQFAILSSSLLMAFLRFGGSHFWISWLGWWIILATLNLHILGSSFAVTMLMDRGISNARRRIISLAVIVAAGAGLAWWLRNSFPAPPLVEPGADAATIFAHYVNYAVNSGPLPYLLFPFKLLSAPFLARNAGEFIAALPGALAIMGLHYLWVMRANVAFEEASVDAARRTAERVAAIRSGNWQAANPAKKPGRSPFRLDGAGFPAMALMWKNVIAASNMITIRFWIMLAWLTVVSGFIFRSQIHSGAALALTSMIGLLLGFSVAMGPSLLRNDFRQDLPAADLLKSFPLAGWEVALGEVLAPAAILTAAQWLLLILALVCCPGQWDKHALPLGTRVGCFVAAALVLPAVNFANLIIRNTAALFVPAWFQLGKDGPRGIENTGQQLILVLGQTLALALMLIVPAIAFAVVWFSTSLFVGPLIALALGGLAALAALGGEAALGLRLMGSMFERLDLSKEQFSAE